MKLRSGGRKPQARWRRAIPGLACAAVVALGCAEAETRPDILLVTLDTLRRDHVGSYGDPRGLTPALDAIAASGLVHDSAFTTMPTTGPAHVSLFTGLRPADHGVLRNGDALTPEKAEHTAVADLQRAGYATAAFVTTRWMNRRSTGLQGFDVYDAPPGSTRAGSEAVAAALAWLDTEPRRPVFLFVHLYDAHAPYGTGAEKKRGMRAGLYGWIDPKLYATPIAHERMAQRYARGVRDVDSALGALLVGVQERLPRLPLILVTADHGESLDEHLTDRGFAYDHGEFLDLESVLIPLVLAGPGVAPGRSAGSVSIRDLADTLRIAAQLEVPAEARDLRRPDERRRVVTMQRRRFAEDVRPLMRPRGRAYFKANHTHAAAASDGTHLVIVGENGVPSQLPAGAPPDLLESARTVPLSDRPLPPLDPELRRALESLGYAE